MFLIDNAEKTYLKAKVKEIEIKQNEAIPKNIRGKIKMVLYSLYSEEDYLGCCYLLPFSTIF